MHPVLFYIGSIPIFSYGIFVLLGTVTLFAIALSLGRKANRSWEQIWPVAIGVFVGGILGARVSHLVVEPSRFDEFSNFYSLMRPGTPGNILGLLIGGYLGGAMVRYSLDLPSTANFYAPALAAGSVIWRVGCTLAGCCYGKETELPWAINIEGIRRHPTMIYEGLFNLALLVIIWWLRPKIRKDGALLMLYIVCYVIFRFWLEFIRVYPPLMFGLTGIQFLCLFTLILVCFWIRQQNFQLPQFRQLIKG